MKALRNNLIKIALAWQKRYGVAPSITSALSEYDAARLVNCSEKQFCAGRANQTAVTRGYDFEYNGKRYQVKANRPSGNYGSTVTLVSKAKNYDWDYLIWILYDKGFRIQEAWKWSKQRYKAMFHKKKRLSPRDMRKGFPIYFKRQEDGVGAGGLHTNRS